jgi:hypothetical protein
MDSNLYIDAFEDALGVKIKDRRSFLMAFQGLVTSCKGSEDDGEENEDQGKRKGLPSVAIMLGKPGLKKAK